MSEKNTAQNPALLAAGCLPDVMIWQNVTGVFRSFDGSRVVKVGNAGAADSLGVVAVKITPEMVGQVVGVAIACEFKAATGKQSQGQKNWQAAFSKRGGKYRVIRSPDEILIFIDDVKRGMLI